MERGKRPLPDVVLLQRIADTPNIPPQLLGLAPRHTPCSPWVFTPHPSRTTTRVAPLPSFGEEGEDPVRRRNLLAAGLATAATGTALGAGPASAHPALASLEDLLLHRGGPGPGTEATAHTVSAALAASQREFGTCRYETLARALPGRIALARALGGQGGAEERSANAVAELYNTATRLCIKLGEDGLAAVTADRALTAALAGADALTVAEAHRMVSSSWRRQGHHARAADVAASAAQQLAADRTAPVAACLSVQGNLYATAAYTAAKQGDRHTAHVLIEEAAATAERLGQDEQRAGTAFFGPSQVLLHRISISQLLGDAGQAIDHARSVDAAALPTAERQARYWIDVARSFGQWGKPDRCYRALLAAEAAAAQEVRRGAVRVLAADLVRYDRRLPGVRAFAQRIGALA
ncbi:XRE family transcriptional regulator [Streptomyces sp. NPDC057638]|uniref:XRE family transcriptional regulator n=1 Tax=Streptomyces sp. NPDC057638 TaxID=3346190 RepID=UPI0036ACEF7F